MIGINREVTHLQYLSKLDKTWKDFKYTDSYEELKKYKYKIRVNPKYQKCKE